MRKNSYVVLLLMRKCIDKSTSATSSWSEFLNYNLLLGSIAVGRNTITEAADFHKRKEIFPIRCGDKSYRIIWSLK